MPRLNDVKANDLIDANRLFDLLGEDRASDLNNLLLEFDAQDPPGVSNFLLEGGGYLLLESAG